MRQSSGSYLLYVLLYTVFWNALAVIAYRLLVLDGVLPVSDGLYFFMAGLLFIVCGAVRALSPYTKMRRTRCPIVGSFYVSGILLILFANLA
ncbi:hypothetical protein CIG75_17860 [Tumebacillus algifaecis]|uniref:Uncharacterized protein n=1 Tax=Tumebacillus algifaecis TaxID=1214604 RepID=A0A223D4Z9_9BACL|nr:hypothetical protein [Tumebacillus algifaecis]ASS76651.1 hypothetical protein CIG75_17860 [Tumebacillus algifaecis]